MELYNRHRVNNCPSRGCGVTLNVQDFKAKTSDEEEFEKEKRVRKELRSVFNKTLTDFGGNANAYNEYLENVETFVAKLVTGSDREKAEIEATIAAYKTNNTFQISMNAAQQHATAQAERDRLAAEAQAREAGHRAQLAADAAARQQVERVRRHVMDVLLGDKKAVAADDRAGLAALKQKLLDLQSAQRSGASSAAASTTDSKAQQQLQPLLRFVPCPTIFPPRFISYTHPTEVNKVDVGEVSSSRLRALQRTGGRLGVAAAARAQSTDNVDGIGTGGMDLETASQPIGGIERWLALQQDYQLLRAERSLLQSDSHGRAGAPFADFQMAYG